MTEKIKELLEVIQEALETEFESVKQAKAKLILIKLKLRRIDEEL